MTRKMNLAAFAMALALSLWASARPALAADPKVPSPISAYLDNSTIAVARADLTRVDPQAAETWVTDLLKAGNAEAAQVAEITTGLKVVRPAAEQWLADFRKAGGRDVYALVTLADMPAPPVVIVPLGPGADAAQVVRLFGPPPEKNDLHAYGFERPLAERVGDVVAYAQPQQLARLRATKPTDRTDLAKALDAAGDAPLALAVAPSADSRRAIEGLLPTLPKEIGGAPSTTVTRGVQWAILAVRPPPQPSIKLVIQSQDAAAAEALSGLIGQAFAFAAAELKAVQRRDEQALGQRPGTGASGGDSVRLKLLSALIPKQVGDRLELSMDADEITRVAGAALVGPVHQQRMAAARAVSANNMKQLILGCYMWAEEHKDEWPDKIEDAAKKTGAVNLMTNPARPGTGYTYLKPPVKPAKAPAEIVVLYESEATDVGKGNKALNVGFMDGHVQFMGEDGLKALLKEQAAPADKR